MNITTDLPINQETLDPNFDVSEPLQVLQTMLNRRNIDIDSLDDRGVHNEVLIRGRDPKELELMIGSINRNPQQSLITSRAVRTVNEKYYKSLYNSNPMFILPADMRTHNNVPNVRKSNQSFAFHRDIFAIPPPIDVQQRIFNLLSQR